MPEEVKSIVFMEFIPLGDCNGGKDIFVGNSEEGILEYTKGGTEFGGMKYDCCRVISSEDFELLKPKFKFQESWQTAIEAVTSGGVRNFYVGYAKL